MTVSSDDSTTKVGRIATATVGVVLLAWAVTVDFTKAAPAFFSDGATYYTLAHSLAKDFDFEYRREDLVRVWHEYPSGPEGIFLKKGRDVQGVAFGGGPPFIQLRTIEDTDSNWRLYFGKSFIFPLFAAPFVAIFGTNGFMVLHALLMTACFACAYAFLAARSTPAAAVIFAAAFLFLSIAPVYMVWLTPDFFNLAIVLIAYFFWTYKEVAQPSSRWFTGQRSDLIAAALLGIATFSKPTHILLIGPVLTLLVIRRQWIRGLMVGACFALVTTALFGWNAAIAGEWNYQGGEDRKTFYGGMGVTQRGFPFQTAEHTFAATGLERETNRVPVEVLANRDAFTVFRHNLLYFFFGRHTGFVPYFLPGAAATLLFLLARKQRQQWQWLVLAGGLGSAIALMLYMPFTYSGGGGPVGNRYFLGVYPVFLFVTPPIGVASSVIATGLSALFTAQLVTNPFFTSFNSSEHSKKGIYRLLPVELTILNDLPVGLTTRKARQPLGGTPPISAYFLDDNAFDRECQPPDSGRCDAFWVRGGSRAELILRATSVSEQTPAGERQRSLSVPRIEVQLETGPVSNRVTIDTGAEKQVVEIPAGDRRTVTLAMPDGVPYRPFPETPTNYGYLISIESESGFIPMFVTGGRDFRNLGVFVRLVPLYQ